MLAPFIFQCLANYQERRSFPWPLVIYNTLSAIFEVYQALLNNVNQFRVWANNHLYISNFPRQHYGVTLRESTCVSSLCCRIDATIYIATYIALRSLDQSILQSDCKSCDFEIMVSKKSKGQEPCEGVFRVMDRGQVKEAKICCVCQRSFTWRKKWERCWSEVTTCSDSCKHKKKQFKQTPKSAAIWYLSR